MLLRLLVFFYFAFRDTFLGCLSVAQSTQYQDAYDSEDLIRRQAVSFGVSMFSQINFQGSGTITSDASVQNPITVLASFELLGNAWAAITSSDNTTTIFWDSVPDTNALPLAPPLSITNIQSSGCSPQCSSGGTCNPSSPVCICLSGFSGAQCQSCAEGHFGPSCQPCPSSCKTTCDQGTSGTGVCLNTTLSAASKCKCENAECDSTGACNCLPGWGTSQNGTECGQCAQGFFLTSAGGCQTCQLGCSSCDDQTGDCITCQNGFTQNPTDKTTCSVQLAKTSNGEVCPSATFQDTTNSTQCHGCAAECASCTGSSSNDCTVCANLRAMFNNSCVSTNSEGICEGSGGMIANNNNHKCEGCGAIEPNCVTCEIPNFNVASTINQAKCTGCLTGFFLSDGKCVKTCPSGTFGSDNVCTDCSSSCSSCSGAPDNCTACKEGLVSIGKCVSKCPSQTFISNDTCINCHPDCETCNGTAFNQCESCPQSFPVLDSGRCLQTCNQTQFLASNTCENCDPSCSSCFGPGPSGCLACASPSTPIVANGTCVAAPQLGSPS